MDKKMKILWLITGFITTFFTLTLIQKEDLKDKRTTKEFNNILQNAEHGDIILIQNNELFSQFFKDISKCKITSFKTVYKKNNKTLFLSSDFETTDDNKSGIVQFTKSNMKGFYPKHTKAKLIRIKNTSIDDLKKIDEIYKISEKKQEEENYYDFTWNTNNFEHWNCLKIAYYVYGEKLFNNELKNSRTLFKKIFPCDLNWNNIDEVTDWVEVRL